MRTARGTPVQNRLTAEQHASYWDEGYLYLPNLISEEDLAPLRQRTDSLIEASRSLRESDSAFALEEGHSETNPRLRRIAFLDDLDETFWRFAKRSKVLEIVADLLGPDIKFRDIKVNFKWEGGGSEIRWHQDFAYFPHTNHATCQALLQLGTVGADDGPVKVLPGSHRHGVFDHYDQRGDWTGHLRPEDLQSLPLHKAEAMTGPAGSLLVLHGAVVHSSEPTTVDRRRSMLIIGYSAGDAMPVTPPLYPGSHYGETVHGSKPRCARFEAMSVRLPPAWPSPGIRRARVSRGD